MASVDCIFHLGRPGIILNLESFFLSSHEDIFPIDLYREEGEGAGREREKIACLL